MYDFLINKLNQLAIPTNFVKLFATQEEFEGWCELGTPDDLKAVLVKFEQYEELYEHCSIIHRIMKEKEKENAG